MSCCNFSGSNSAIEQAVNDAIADRITDMEGYSNSASTSAADAAASATAAQDAETSTLAYRDQAQQVANQASALVPDILETSQNLEDIANTLDAIATNASSYIVAKYPYTVVGGESTVTIPSAYNALTVQALYINGVRQDSGYGFTFDTVSKVVTLAEPFTDDMAGDVVIFLLGQSNVDSPETVLSTLASASGAGYIGTSDGSTVQEKLDSMNTVVDEAVQGLQDNLANTSNVTLGDAMVGVKSELEGSVPRTQHSVNAQVVSILDFITDVTADATSALNTALTSRKRVLIPYGTSISISGLPSTVLGELIVEGELKVTGNTTLACRVNVQQGTINVATGYTLTITGSFTCDFYKCFTGAGTVLGIRHVYPEWWGAVSDSTTDSTTAVQAALNCVGGSSSVLGVRPCFEGLSGGYLISSTVTIPNSANIGIEFKGQGSIFAGTRFKSAATFTGDAVLACEGTTDGIQSIADFFFHDFGIVPVTVGSGASIGLRMGTATAGTTLIGLKESRIHDIYIANFSYGIQVNNCRLINWARVSVWNDSMTKSSGCMLIQAVGAFCGDQTFEKCQFVSSNNVTGSKDVHIVASGSYANSKYQIAGLRFTECIFYPAKQEIYIACLNGAYVADIFFTNCQFDGSSDCMIWVDCNGTNSLFEDLQIINCYMWGGSTSVSAAIQFVTGATGIMRNLTIDGGSLGNTTVRAINFTTGASNSIYGIRIHNLQIIDFYDAANAAIEIGAGCERTMITGVQVVAKNVTNKIVNPFKINSGAIRTMIANTISDGVRSGSAVLDNSGDSNNVIVNNM